MHPILFVLIRVYSWLELPHPATRERDTKKIAQSAEAPQRASWLCFSRPEARCSFNLPSRAEPLEAAALDIDITQVFQIGVEHVGGANIVRVALQGRNRRRDIIIARLDHAHLLLLLGGLGRRAVL